MGEEPSGFSRWWLVFAAAVAMGAAGTYQFTWSSIRVAFGARIAAPEAALGTVFTVFVVFQTLSQFPAGWIRDRYGPRVPLLIAAPLVAVGYAGVAFASSPLVAYLAYAVGGVGAGIVYTVAVNTPVKWFDDHRGLATGIATTTYSGLSFVLIPALRRGVENRFRGTLLLLAGGVGLAVLLGVPILRDPEREGEEAAGETGDATDEGISRKRQYGWREAIRTWQFWLLYVVFVVVNGVGLMLVGKVVSFVGALGLPEAAATASASFVALGDAAGLVVVGGISDRFDRARTVAASLTGSGLAIGAAVGVGLGGMDLAFVAAVAAAAFLRSPAFVILPSLVGEYYGTAYSSEVYAALYTSKLWGGVIGGVATSALITAVGWVPSFALGAGVLTLAGLATFLSQPVDRRSTHG